MKKLIILITMLIFSGLTFAQSVEIKDGDNETLMIVNDEGEDKSSLTIPSSTSPPDPTTNKLYNEGGTLKWSGTTLATGSSLWTLNSGNVYRSTGNVGIGTTNPLSELSVGGNGISNATIYGYTFTGAGVYGYAQSGSDINYGGYFIANGEYGRAVYGEAGNSNEAVNTGGYFKSLGSNGYGVYGVATGSSGYGVSGYADDANGVNYGVRGRTDSPNGWAGYFEGRGYFSGNVGIGTTNPIDLLHIYGGAGSSGVTFQNDVTDTAPADGLWVGYTTKAYLWNGENTALQFGTNNQTQMSITETGNVGIGTTNPSATLQVSGTTKIGTNANVVAISDIIELTGTTDATGTSNNIAYPSDWTMNNTRVLTYEIKKDDSGWDGTGRINITDSGCWYRLEPSWIVIFYSDLSSFHSKPYRIVVMKIS